MDRKVRKFRVRVPEMIVSYEVDERQFLAFAKEWSGEDPADVLAYVKSKVHDDIVATMEIGRFGDADYGLLFDGAQFAEHDPKIIVTEVEGA